MPGRSWTDLFRRGPGSANTTAPGSGRACLPGSRPRRYSFEGRLILKTEGRIYFGNAQNVGDQIWPQIADANPKVLLLDCGATPNFEFTALKMLNEAESKLTTDGIELWLAALTPEALELIQSSPLGQRLGRQSMFFTVPHAVERYSSTHPTQGKRGDNE